MLDGAVAADVDRSVGVVGADVVPARRLQHAGGSVGIGEGEHPRRAWRATDFLRGDMSSERGAWYAQPLVRAGRLPAHKREAAAGTRRRVKVAERRDGVVEEHDPEPRDDGVE